MQRTPAGLPLGMPGIAEEILGAIQHAPQPRRQSIFLPFGDYLFNAGADPSRSFRSRQRNYHVVILQFINGKGITPG